MLSKMELAQFPAFLNLTPIHLESLSQQVKVHCFNEHDQIIHKGDSVSGAYLVISGCLRVFTVDVNGKELTLYEIKPGESCLLALNCIFSRMLYPAWVSCSAPMTKVAVIPATLYKQLYASEKSIQNFTVETLSHRVFNLMSAMEEAMFFSVEQRIASYVMRKANEDLQVKTSHQDIASEIGSVREVVSKVLKRLEDDETVLLSRGRITIKNIAKLRQHLS